MRTSYRPARRVGLPLLALSLAFYGCAGSDDGGMTGPTPQPTLDVTVTVASIQVVKDCDDSGFPGNLIDNDTEGEFAYRFWVKWPDGTLQTIVITQGYPGPGTNGESVRKGAAGTTWTFGGGAGASHRRVLNGPGPVEVEVFFAATEWDKYADGWERDPWMSAITKQTAYVIRTGEVSDGNASSSFSLSLPGAEDECLLRANYKIRTVEGTTGS